MYWHGTDKMVKSSAKEKCWQVKQLICNYFFSFPLRVFSFSVVLMSEGRKKHTSILLKPI